MDDTGLGRKHLTFEQAEGVEPLPEQLKLRELSPRLRASLWQVFYSSINERVYPGDAFGRPATIVGEWAQIFYDKHVLRDHKMVDDFNNSYNAIIPSVKAVFSNGDYIRVFGLTQWVLRHPSCPHGLSSAVDGALENARAAYRVVDGDTIAPITSEDELNNLKRAVANVTRSEFSGARQHLRSAASELSLGN